MGGARAGSRPWPPPHIKSPDAHKAARAFGYHNVSHGVDVRDLPEQAAIERLLEEHHIKMLT